MLTEATASSHPDLVTQIAAGGGPASDGYHGYLERGVWRQV